MSKASNAEASRKFAAYMLSKGIYHGKRTTSPYANSGGTTMTQGPGSSKAQRRNSK